MTSPPGPGAVPPITPIPSASTESTTVMETATATGDVAVDPLDIVQPGDPNVTEIDDIPLNGCTYTWMIKRDLRTYTVVCTRASGHEGKQHVAEGTPATGILAVHPWKA